MPQNFLGLSDEQIRMHHKCTEEHMEEIEKFFEEHSPNREAMPEIIEEFEEYIKSREQK